MPNIIDPVLAPALSGLLYPGFSINLEQAGVLVAARLDSQGLATVVLRPLSADKTSQVEDQMKSALLALPQVKQVKLEWQKEEKTTPNAEPLPIMAVGKTIAIASCKGGVGKSTVAVNLAWALYSQGFKVGLLDLDIYGPSLPTLLKLEEATIRADKDGNFIPVDIKGLKALSVGFMAGREQSLIWRGPMLVKMVTQLLHKTSWGKLDFLLIDMPPGTGDVQMSLLRHILLQGVVMVSTPQAASLSDTLRGLAIFNKAGVPIIGMVENMGYYKCPCCGNIQYIFGKNAVQPVAQQHGIDFWGSIPLNPENQALTAAYDENTDMAGIYRDLADKLLIKLKD